MNNTPVLMWHPTPQESDFGLGGEPEILPECVCGSPMAHVGMFPLQGFILQFFYCMDCERESAVNLGKDQNNGFLVLSLTEKEAVPVRLHIKKSSEENPWISYKPTSATMSPTPNRHLNEYPPGDGVYTHGLAPVPSPLCPDCKKPNILALSMDCFAHENFPWGDLGSVFVWICPKHKKNVVLKVITQP